MTTSQTSTKSPRKPIVNEPTKKQVTAHEPLPDLDPIFDSFVDAVAFVQVSLFALEEGGEEQEGAAIFTLSHGLAALKSLEDRLGSATTAVNRIRRARGDK